jgi:hypothetical protein
MFFMPLNKKNAPAGEGGGVSLLCLDQVKPGFRIEQVRQRTVEREVELIAVLEPVAVLGGQVYGCNTHDAVLANRRNVDIQLAAHHFGNVHLRGNGILASAVGELDVFGADAQNDLAAGDILCFQRALDILRQVDGASSSLTAYLPLETTIPHRRSSSAANR